MMRAVIAIGRAEKVEDHSGGAFTLRIDKWHMATLNDQLRTSVSV